VLDEGGRAMNGPVSGLHFGVVGVTDTERSLGFYRGVLGFDLVERRRGTGGRGDRCLLASGQRLLVLQELSGEPAGSAWVRDDIQAGMRHIGLKVDDVDRWAERVRAAGAPFTLEPQDAFGGVRLCFFLDPDGSHLEFVAGNVSYTAAGSPGLVSRERAMPVPASPRFDHVAVSVADLDRALAFYTGRLGFPILGQLREDNPARGFTITYLQAGPGILEVFSFSEPVLANSFDPAAPAPGLLSLGLGAGDVPAAAGRIQAAGGALLAAGDGPGAGRALLTDPDGTPLEVSSAPFPP
jgi:catechol 2,3-dioxygenase-like lactoylglutathione lyase family enzyme